MNTFSSTLLRSQSSVYLGIVNLSVLSIVFLTPHQLGHLTLEDYQIWSVKSSLANEFLNLLFQVSSLTFCAVVVELVLKLKCSPNHHAFLYMFVCCFVSWSRSAT